MSWSEFIRESWEKAGDGRKVLGVKNLQDLWSGYGQIARLSFEGGSTMICKVIDPSGGGAHPRGWSGDRSHQRKVRSYEVEGHWYKKYEPLSDALWPKCYGQGEEGRAQLIWLEDLDAMGYGGRRSSLSEIEMESVLKWLGHFHGWSYGKSTEGLWPKGTYWHLETRPDELQALEDKPLKAIAEILDQRLNDCPHRSLVHGDAKVANFCFHSTENKVAAVDFQYIGGGVGVQDLVYFFGSCCREDILEELEGWVLECYFQHLRQSLRRYHPEVNPSEVEDSWRGLYDVAWTDFHRFLKGWSPSHWKLSSYSEMVKSRCVEKLKEES